MNNNSEFMPVECLNVPKVLFYDKQYEDLSMDAKLIYALLLDRKEMAIRNEWVDEYGDTYVIYPKQEIKKYLNISRYRIDQALAELEEHDQMVEVEVPYLAQLHWIISDENESITVESMSDGLHIYDNPVGVLTNNPPFPQQMFQLNNYMYLSPKQPRNTFCENLALDAYSRGMGGLGLPGDLSSSSRFVRVAFTKVNAISGESEEESVSQFFHILGSVDQQRGCCEVADGKYEITLYTSCCNVTKGIYYYNTYENHQISAVDMHVENLDSDKMICYPVIQGERINYQNK